VIIGSPAGLPVVFSFSCHSFSRNFEMSFSAPPGSIPYPVPMAIPQHVADTRAHTTQNIPSASSPRSVLPASIPIVDNSKGNQQTIGYVPVQTQHMPPTAHPDDETTGAADVFQNLPAVAMAARQAAAEIDVHFSLMVAGVPEEFDWSYVAVIQEGNLLVFVSDNNAKSWFPPDRDEPLALRIGNNPEVHLGQVLPLSFAYNGQRFRVIMSLEQHAIPTIS